ncbi:MAG TPA: sigma-70 family RNA polymerase sigma factor [Gemmataceae bacterium]|nr:sigma-70 family RNA polymerase sigma factor [Gemmataceae bacterium]
MATNPTSQVIQHLRRVLLQENAGLTDGQLLGIFIESRDEAAFAALVKRHGRLVWNVCRRLLGPQDAEDAFQATFLVLCRKAASIRRREMLASWLYGVAYQTALQARRTAARRRRWEKQVVDMPEPAVMETDLWHDLQPLLDQELSRLPDNYQMVILLCDLEGKTRKEVARQLGLPEGTVASRLTRARAILAKRLARHGLAVTGGTLAAVLSQKAVSASVPASTMKGVAVVAAGQVATTGALSVKVAALAEGVLKTMLLNKLVKLMELLLVLGVLSGGAGLIYHMQAAEPAKQRRVSSAPPVKERTEKEPGELITHRTRKAIEAGLKLLAEEQHADGSFGKRGYQGNVGITSLAGLAFLAAGHEPDDSSRGKIVGKAVDFVLSQENRGGGHPGYLHNPAASPHGPMYNHGFATLFLAFLHGKKKDKSKPTKYDEVLERAVQLIVSSQNKEGGWRYTPTSKDADLTVTACQMLALAAARQSGLKVPKKTTDAGVSYIRKCFTPATGGFAYMMNGGGKPVFSRNAAALAALQTMGIDKGEEVERGLASMITNQLAPTPRPDMHYFYGRYYGARVLHRRGGKAWKDWYTAIRKELLERQRPDGSWDDQIDPHYATAMACLVLLTPEGRLEVQPRNEKDDAVNKERKRLEGTWRVVAVELGGKQTDREEIGPNNLLVFSGSKMSAVIGTKKRTIDCTFTIDPTKNPKWIDTTRISDKVSWPGIYELKGDTLKVFLGGGKRPTQLKTREGTLEVIHTYQRIKR